MTEQEAIEKLKGLKHLFTNTCEKIDENTALDMAISALEEIQQYRKLGTVEELKEAKEKQIAKKPKNIDEDMNIFDCPCCGHTILAIDSMTIHQNCLMCGQKLDWSEI